MATGSLPTALDDLPNLRDLGGLSTDDGGTTRHGVLLRSAAPLPGDRLPELACWPPGAVVDLRSSDELGGRDHPLAEHAMIHPFPLLRGALRTSVDWSAVADLEAAYRMFLADGAAKLARLAELVAHSSAPVLVHCAAGKDRTGVAVAVLLRAVGVSRRALLADYQRTEEHLPRILARVRFDVSDSSDPTRRQRLLGVSTPALEAVLDTVDAAPGGAAGWLCSHGAEDGVMDAWRRRIL